MTKARVAQVDLPEFGMPDEMPVIPGSVYETRLGRLRTRMKQQGYDQLVIFADREHSA
ncbi:MAG: hypothetical protein GY773_18320, partial [Actinomycetia bacterium]|nr:hypothetical protein [Actinomycetes bacterium]